MVLALADKWIWDFWLAEDGGDWHAYFLQADNTLANPDMRHWHVSHGHAVSRNLKDWTYRGTCFGPAREPAWDDCTTWTGSVLRDDSGVWHLFYTGTTHETKGVHQRIGQLAQVGHVGEAGEIAAEGAVTKAVSTPLVFGVDANGKKSQFDSTRFG